MQMQKVWCSTVASCCHMHDWTMPCIDPLPGSILSPGLGVLLDALLALHWSDDRAGHQESRSSNMHAVQRPPSRAQAVAALVSLAWRPRFGTGNGL